jgi:Predicted redox protein, regulator of disulfide bond formation
MGMEYDLDMDARILLCPLPVLRLRKRLGRIETDQVALLVAIDPMAAVDVPHLCAEAGHVFLGEEEIDGVTAYFMRKG